MYQFSSEIVESTTLYNLEKKYNFLFLYSKTIGLPLVEIRVCQTSYYLVITCIFSVTLGLYVIVDFYQRRWRIHEYTL
jgi:hypothetical protein